MQPVHDPRQQEPRHRHPAALDEDPPQTTPGQRDQKGREVDPRAVHRDRQHLRMAQTLRPWRAGFMGQPGGAGQPSGADQPSGTDQQGGRAVAKHLIAVVQPPRRVQDHPHRRRPLHLPRGQLRIIRAHRARAHQYRVRQGAQPMGVFQVGFPADPARLARNRRDPPVQRLGDAAEHETPVRGGRRRQQRIVQRRTRRIRGLAPQQGFPNIRREQGHGADLSRPRT